MLKFYDINWWVFLTYVFGICRNSNILIFKLSIYWSFKFQCNQSLKNDTTTHQHHIRSVGPLFVDCVVVSRNLLYQIDMDSFDGWACKRMDSLTKVASITIPFWSLSRYLRAICTLVVVVLNHTFNINFARKSSTST
jgi:hypothetical protein